MKTHLLIPPLIIGLMLSPIAFSAETSQSAVEGGTVLVFESEDCDACQTLASELEALQKALSPNLLTITRHVLGKPESEEAFTRYGITSLPAYVVLNQHQEVVYTMTGTIALDQLAWEIREVLGQNEILDVPSAFATWFTDVEQSQAPLILLFWRWDDPDGQQLAQGAFSCSDYFLEDVPVVLSFDADKPEVQDWMRSLGLAESPTYIVVRPNMHIYRKSPGKAYAWQLAMDLQAYAQRFIPESQTILVRLTQPVPDDDGILPVTMPPQSQPASAEPSPL